MVPRCSPQSSVCVLQHMKSSDRQSGRLVTGFNISSFGFQALHEIQVDVAASLDFAAQTCLSPSNREGRWRDFTLAAK